MKKQFLKMCSLVLSLILLMNMMPMSVFAQEYREYREGADGKEKSEKIEESIETDVTEPAFVVEEIEEKRTEYTKEYLLSNGLHMAAMYGEPVHYETDGGWEEIDNTLRSADGDALANTAGLWDVRFPRQLSKDKSVTIQKDGYTLSFFMAGELTERAAVEIPVMPMDPVESASGAVNEASTAAAVSPLMAEIAALPGEIETEPFRISHMAQADAELLETEGQAVDATYEETVIRKNISRLQYSDIYPETDIMYDLEGNKVKESVVLEKYRSNLLGYRYTLDVGQLRPVLQEDGSILFYDEGQAYVVMSMPAPYLVDGEQAYSYDIDVTLTGSGSSYTLTYLLPQEWLGEEERAWPVILDPAVYAKREINNVRDVTVGAGRNYSYNWGMNSCGYGSEALAHRFFLKYSGLPKLETSDVILQAKVYMILEPSSAGGDMTVEVHKVNSGWESESLTWANQPGYNSRIEDYAIVSDQAVYSWTVTDIVRDWYTGSNTGMMFKASDTVEQQGVVKCKQFWSSDYGVDGSRPTLEVIFRNNNGIESYWDYTTASAGSAGTGYVNTYTGNLVWVHEDMGYEGNRMPVSISHIYNMNDLAHNDFAMGNGWRTNYHERVYRYEENNSYYVWEDSDGTRHYFLYNRQTGSYDDEDGLELTLKVENTAYGSYSITDKSGNIRYFDSMGRLVRIQNNQKTVSAITVTYQSGTNYCIASVTDGAGRSYIFDYANGNLSKIRYTGSSGSTISEVSFSYSGSRLTRITRPEGLTSDFGYDSTYYVMQVVDPNGYKIAFDYNTVVDSTYQPYRIIGIREYGGSTAGGYLTLEYFHNETKLTDYNGNVEIRQYNDFGNVTSIQDDEGRAQFAQYAKNDLMENGAGNQLTLNSKLQNTVANLISDSGFESANPWTPRSNTTASLTENEAYIGYHSLKMTASGTLGGVYSTMFYVPPWETVTFSTYVKTNNRYNLMLQKEVSVGYYVDNRSDVFIGNGQWQRQEFSYKNNTGSTVKMWAFLESKEAGTFYMDCAQVEISPTASRYNILENGDFTYSEAGKPAYYWTGFDLGSTERLVSTAAKATPYLSGNVLSVTGDPTADKRLVNYVGCTGNAGDCFVISGWAWTNGGVAETGSKTYLGTQQTVESNREFSITLTLNHHDGTSSYATAKFNPSCTGWQYAAAVVVAKQSYFTASVKISYGYNANEVWFDGLQLFKEQFGTSYTYDEDGNIISVTDLQKQTTQYEYDSNNNLTRILQNNKAKMTYEYDNYHNVTKATSEEGLVYQFAYDDYGNNDSVSIVNGTEQINAIAEYSSNGNYLDYVEDPLNRLTDYSYDEQTGELLWMRQPRDYVSTQTNYEYDDLSRLRSVEVSPYNYITNSFSDMSVQYSYNGAQLSRISVPGTDYNFSYNSFGASTQVSVGNWYLAQYSYQARTNLLTGIAYHNGDSVSYSYDTKGRLKEQSYEDGATVYYGYDNSGNLAEVTDGSSGQVTRNYYDLTDRLMKYTRTGGGVDLSVQYTYDEKNNMTGVTETVDGRSNTVSYTYDDDNRVISMVNGSVTQNYTYDAFGRVSKKETVKNGSVVKTETYLYKDLSAGRYTSSQVKSHIITTGGSTVTHNYDYDLNGNIIAKYDGVGTHTYSYDSMNQLIRENDPISHTTTTWSYDANGNMLTRKSYGYTTENSFYTPDDQVTYGYNDSQWGDWLSTYDGENFYNDALGNLTNEGGRWFYTWEHGRQLKSLSNGTTTWNYSYDADGMRTQRSNGTVTYRYVYNGSQLTKMTKGSDTLYFTYDADGAPLTVTYNGTQYFYVTNLQGDVVAIVDSTGAQKVSYRYDAWGTPLSTGGTMASTLGQVNPLRYRGYVYDREVELYYLQSRYYSHDFCRFISPDAFVSTGQGILGYNMFAYCNNNAVNCIDKSGMVPDDILLKNMELYSAGGNVLMCGYANNTTSNSTGSTASQVAAALWNNLEISAGIGQGLFVETDVLDIIGIEAGMYGNYAYIQLEDGKVSFGQEINQGIAVTFFGHNFGKTNYIFKQNGLEVINEDNEWFYTDDTWTIYSFAAYPLAGVSFAVEFDIIQFCIDWDKIF